MKEAFKWYERTLVEGLAKKFIEQVDKSRSQLAFVPGKGSIRYNNIRSVETNFLGVHFADVEMGYGNPIYLFMRHPQWNMLLC